MYLILEYDTAWTPSKLYVPACVIWLDVFPVTFDVSSIYPFIYFVSSSVTLILTPPNWSTASETESKLTVTNSFIFKSKFLLSVLIASGASPYEYACVILSRPCTSIFTYVSLYTDTNFISPVELFILAIIIQSLLFPTP